jgi:hypothetical protein
MPQLVLLGSYAREEHVRKSLRRLLIATRLEASRGQDGGDQVMCAGHNRLTETRDESYTI